MDGASLCGFASRGGISLTENLWYDEGYTAALVSHSVRELVEITSKDVHAPFYYILLKAFYTLCGGGRNYWSLKLFSLLFMTAYLFLGKYEVKKLYDEQTAVYFMLFSILMPSMCVQAGNARMYAMGLFFFSATGFLACEILRCSSLKKWILFCICSICSVYSHTFTMLETFLLYLIFLAVLIYQKKYALLKWFFGSGILTAACYAGWLTVLWRQFAGRATALGGNGELFIPNLYTLMDYCKDWFSASETPITLVVYLGMALTLFLGYFAVDQMRSSGCYIPAFGLGVVGLCALIGCLLSYYVTPCFLGRYVFTGFGALAVWYAAGMRKIRSLKIKAAVLLVFFLCFGLQYRSELRLEYDQGLREYEAFYEENIRPEDLIMATEIHTLYLNIYHPERRYMVYGYLEPFSPFQNTTVFTEWEQLEDVGGDIWLFALEDRDLPGFAPYYGYGDAFRFHFMYYDFVIYRLLPLETADFGN